MALALIFCAIPFCGVAWKIFGHNPSGLIALYPIALLILFRRPETGIESPTNVKKWIAIFPGSVLLLCGLIFGRLSLIWIGSFWNFLAICYAGGVTFAFPAPLLIFAAPPLAAFTSVVAGFSLRLWLSGIVAKILTLFLETATAQGNVILFRGSSFTVDRVCEGMKMAVATFLIAAVLARFSSARGSKFILILTFPLWLLANVLRILALVIFKVPASSSSHEILGLVFFGTVVLFPLLLLALAFPKPTEGAPVSTIRPSTRMPKFALAIVGALCLGFLLTDHKIPEQSWPSSILDFTLNADSVREDPRIAIYSKDETTVIVKKDLFAPGTAHDPRICFEAAGFSFGEEKEVRIGEFLVRSARVVKSGKPARLFWWYSWQNTRSASDVDWRIASLRGNRPTQWNLYGVDEPELEKRAENLLRMQFVF